MRTIKYLCFLAAGLFVLAACKRDVDKSQEVDPAGTKKKSFTLNLSGLSMSGSKAVANKSSAGPINLRDIKILLTDGTNIYDEVLFASGSNDYNAAISADGYIFHEVDPAIKKVIVLGNTSGESVNYENVASVKASVMRAVNEQDLSNVLLYGEGNLIPATDPEPTPPHTGSTDYFTVSVKLSPLVARLEVGKIQCDDLGTHFESFKLAAVGLLDISQEASIDGTYISELLMLYNGTTGKIYEPGTSGPVGGYEFGNAPALAWAYDLIPTPLPLFESSEDVFYAENNPAKVFGYSFIPIIGNFPKVKLRLSEVIGVEATTFSWVSTKSFSGVDLSQHPKPGYVYQFDMVFKEANIGPYDPDAKICIDVKVTVDEWTIQPLTPIFY